MDVFHLVMKELLYGTLYLAALLLTTLLIMTLELPDVETELPKPWRTDL